MSATYTYVIQALKTATVNGMQNAVTSVECLLTATESNQQVVRQSQHRTGPVDPQDFTAFEALTEAQIIGWLEAMPIMEEIKSALQSRLTPIIEETTWTAELLPWAS